MFVRCFCGSCASFFFFFFFNDTATTEIYPLSLHDALPIFVATPATALGQQPGNVELAADAAERLDVRSGDRVWLLPDRKSTRLNSSHVRISYAVFCLKKKKD